MKRFQFSLEKVLALREFQEEEARMALGRAVGESERLRRDLETTAQMRVQAAGELGAMSAEAGTKVDPKELMTVQTYLRRLDDQKEELLSRLAQNEIVVAEKRALFAEGMKKRRAFSDLKEKQLRQWKKDTLRAEDAALDEIASRP